MYAYVILCMYICHTLFMSCIPHLLLSLLLCILCDKAKCFEVCSNNKIALIFTSTAYCCL